jgi:hypothetical protein
MSSLLSLRNNVKLSTFDIEALPNHKAHGKYWESACPICGGKDRFVFWQDNGNFWCRRCEIKGFVDQEAQSTLTEDQIADIERRKRQAKQAELDRKRTALERLQAKRPDVIYHKNLNGQTQYLQERWGLYPETIDQFRVGYCQACPTSTYSDSFTIPYYWSEKLVNVRHRLLNPNGSGKYRPEASGLPTAIFNADMIKDEEWLVLVEGEFKAMVLHQFGFPTIAIPGASNDGLIKKSLPLFSKGQTVYVTLDPGADKQAIKIGKLLSGAGMTTRLVSCPVKPDDFFTLYGGTTAQFTRYLETGRAI